MKYLRTIASGIVTILIIIYIAVQLNTIASEELTVQNAVLSTETAVISRDAYIFRDESPLLVGNAGTVCAFFRDGEKVPAGAQVLKIYQLDEDAARQETINDLNDKIAILERSSLVKNYSTTDLETLDASIASKINSIRSAVCSGNLTVASLGEDDLLILMNRRASVLTAASGYDMIIEEYKKQIEAIQSEMKGGSVVITTADSGYYYSDTDGYEEVFSIEALDSMTIESYNQLEYLRPDDTLIAESGGKIVKSSTWYLTVTIDKRTFSKLTQGKSSTYLYKIEFPYFDNTAISMTLDRTIFQTNYDSVVAIFKSNNTPDGFNFTRSQPVAIQSSTYTGLSIPSESIRVDEDGNTFVYVLDGTVVKKKTATVIYDNGSGYCLCELPDENANTISKTKLSLYDPVIVAGSDIYEGKIIK